MYHILYVIQHDTTGGMYIGMTSNLQQRLRAHNSNLNRSTMRKRGTWTLVYAEAYRAKKDAVARELRLKEYGSSKHELFKRISNSMLEAKSEAGASRSA